MRGSQILSAVIALGLTLSMTSARSENAYDAYVHLLITGPFDATMDAGGSGTATITAKSGASFRYCHTDCPALPDTSSATACLGYAEPYPQRVACMKDAFLNNNNYFRLDYPDDGDISITVDWNFTSCGTGSIDGYGYFHQSGPLSGSGGGYTISLDATLVGGVGVATISLTQMYFDDATFVRGPIVLLGSDMCHSTGAQVEAVGF